MIRVLTTVRKGKTRNRTLLVEVLVTGQSQAAFKTLEWYWVRDTVLRGESQVGGGHVGAMCSSHREHSVKC